MALPLPLPPSRLYLSRLLLSPCRRRRIMSAPFDM